MPLSEQSRDRRERSNSLERMTKVDPGSLARYWCSMLTSVVDAAMRITRADMGNIQLFDPASAALRIEAERGFNRSFLKFFDSVHAGHAACGTALERRKQVVIEDVADSPIFLGTPALEVMLDAGARSVQTTPLVGPSGSVLGIVSTHWHRPWRPCGQTLHELDLLSRIAAEWLETRIHLAPINGNGDRRQSPVTRS
jgi:GAF domain-containing protein